MNFNWRLSFFGLVLFIANADAQSIIRDQVCQYRRESIDGNMHAYLACENTPGGSWTKFEFGPKGMFNPWGWVPGDVMINPNFSKDELTGTVVWSESFDSRQVKVMSSAADIMKRLGLPYNPLYQNCYWFIDQLLNAYGGSAYSGEYKVYTPDLPYGGCWKRGWYSDTGWNRCEKEAPKA